MRRAACLLALVAACSGGGSQPAPVGPGAGGGSAGGAGGAGWAPGRRQRRCGRGAIRHPGCVGARPGRGRAGVAGAADPRAAYEALVDQYLADPRFARQMLGWFRDTFRMGGGPLDSAPAFAAGHLKSGWFGGIRRNGDVVGWNPATGQDADMNAARTASAAAAAVAYAVVKGDQRRLADFARGLDLSGVINPVTM